MGVAGTKMEDYSKDVETTDETEVTTNGEVK